MLNETGEEPGAIVGINWAPLAERIAVERAARGWPVVSLEMLRRATSSVARVETVRIHAQNRRISLVSSSTTSPSPTSGVPALGPGGPGGRGPGGQGAQGLSPVREFFPAAPNAALPADFGAAPKPPVAVASVPGHRVTPLPAEPLLPPPAMPGPSLPGASSARPSIVAVAKAPPYPPTMVPTPSLRQELERASHLLASSPQAESTLPAPLILALKNALRAFNDAAAEIAVPMPGRSAPMPAPLEPRTVSVGGRAPW